MNREPSLLRGVIQLERNMRLAIERQILNFPDGASAKRMLAASLYLQVRLLAYRRAVRSGLWKADGMHVTMCLTLAPGDVFFDVGANVGEMTQPAAWLVGSRGSVHSFEPSPATMRYLRRRLVCMGLSNVVLNEFALGSALGSATLYEFAENFGGSSALRPGAAPGQHLSAETQVAVKVLDDYVEQNSISQVRLIKMDVQGSEIDVLRGAKRLLTAPNRLVLFVEVNQIVNAAFGHNVNDLINELMGLDYSLFSWREIGLVSVKTERDIPTNGHDDVICLSPGIHDTLYDQLEQLGRQPKDRIVQATD